MHAAIDIFAVIAASVPTPQSTVDPELVTPGPAGFVAIALITVAVILLVWDMLRRVRRGRYRDEVREDLDAQERERTGDVGGPDDTGAPRS
ncbi:hypothetical protein H9651_04410 [Microbacterium sp. Sa4CUA7]|uniref:Uncharacterized protein n=1 Tax=Microbacterium pullorum TaxID=2762236 RepID=A0ABR8S0K8_9MICO|nr:hypothetical protein [Microbacterium pullorum]MBD7956869.1 hypothetical protein [Microbacterium pullorum]